MSRQSIWIVVPAYNEEAYLARFLNKLSKKTDQVIVVDDGSNDATYEIAKKNATYTLRHKINLGKGAALQTGCDFAFEVLNADAVIIMDGDDQHDVNDLSLFFAHLNKGENVIFGIRAEAENMPLIRRKINRLSSFVTYLLFGAYIVDIPSGFKAFTRSAYTKLRWHATNYAVELEIAARTAKYHLPFTTVCIKTIYHDMNKGFSALDLWAMVVHILKLKLTI